MACCGGRQSRQDETVIKTETESRHKANNVPIKIVLLGQSGVGKSSIVLRYVKGQFNENNDMTIGAAYFYKTLDINEAKVKLDIWDTAGQDRYRCIANMYYRGAAAAIVVYDITDRASFDSAQTWITELSNNANTPVNILLVGNKLDLADSRRSVTTEEGRQRAERNGFLFTEASAKTAENIEEIFTDLVSKIVNANGGIPDRQSQHIKLK